MIKIIKNIHKYLLILLFFCLPLVNSHFLNLIGIEWGFYVNGNYEFSKVVFFNIFSIIIFISFIIKKFINKSQIKTPKILLYIIGIIFLSTIFSDFFYTSLLGNNSKSHSLIMFINLIGIFIVLINQKNKFRQKLIKTTLISSIFVLIIGIKEYYLPTFDYGDLSNRAFSTFGHPNYLALYILIILPLIQKQKTKIYNIFLLIFKGLLIFLLFLTSSAWGILVGLMYLIILIKNKRIKYFLFFISIIIIILFIYNFGLITKLHSFLSRFFIWDTVSRIIFSDIKNIFIGSGLGTLKYVFDGFKSPYLYIFENFGYTADRPHNLLLYIFYSFGLIGFSIFGIIIYNIVKLYKKTKNKNLFYYYSIFLFLIFTIFNFASISHYLIIILIGSIIYNSSNKKNIINNYKIFTLLILIIGIFSFYFSINYYIQEYKIKQNSSYKSNSYLYNKIQSDNYENNLFGDNFVSIQKMCEGLINYSSSVENYFYCGNLLWNTNKQLATIYYNKGLSKLPNLWNSNSKYNNQFLINNFVDTIRFYSKKYSNINEILERTQ